MPSVSVEQALQIAMQHHAQGRLAEAEEIYRQALAVQPGNVLALNNLASVLRGTGRAQEGIAFAQEAIRLAPQVPEPYSNLGVMLQMTGHLNEALAALQHAVQLNPNNAGFHFDFANALQAVGRFDEAIGGYQRAIELNSNHVDAHTNLGTVLHMMGRLDEAIQSDRRALALRPDYHVAHSRMLFTLNFLQRSDPSGIFAEHVKFDEQHAAPFRSAGFSPRVNEKNPDRLLRIGYVSTDFAEHAVGFFLEPILANHDHKNFEIFCYSNAPRTDALMARLQSFADHWRDIRNISDERAAEMVREDAIDILVDLAGHTESNRMMIFARKPAPLQATYLGYPNTSGLKAMDYRITDVIADPPGVGDEFYTEKLARLPRTAWCYRPPDTSPDVGELPALSNGYVTFGSFNNVMKINDEVVALWARVLQAVPGSMLIIKAIDLRELSARERLRSRFVAAGVSADRIEPLAPLPSVAEHLKIYNRIDISLDTFPYNGTTTTCEALWMGVPVITLAGDRHASRVGASLLTSVGLENLIAKTPEDYIAVAIDLTRDVERLAQLRSGMRARLRDSRLLDAQAFTRDLENFYRSAWRDWCSRA